MKKVLLAMLGVLTALPALAHDFSFAYKGQTLTYTVVDAEAKTCRVAQNPTAAGAIEVPAQAIDGDVTYTVTELCDAAFRDCQELSSITLPATVRVIPWLAFYHCSRLEAVTFPDSLSFIGWRTFEGCGSLRSLVIRGKDLVLDDFAFNGCAALTEVDMLGVKSLGFEAFARCSGLTQITLPESVVNINPAAFSRCERLARIDVVPENTAYCSVDGAVYDFNKETLVCLPCTFSGEYVVPMTLKSFTNEHFNNNPGITSFKVEEGNTAFSSVDGVLFNLSQTSLLRFPIGKASDSYTIPSTVVTIDDFAFKSCGELKSVIIPNSVETIGNDAFAWCDVLDSVQIAPSVTTLGSGVFDNCSKLKKADLPNSVTSVGQDTYACCYSLESAHVPNKLTVIPNQMFAQNYSLKSLTIPQSVKEIGQNAFLEIRMSELKFESEVPPATPEDPVYYWGAADNCTVIVPPGAVEAYRNTPYWGRFKNIKDESDLITWSVEDINERVGTPVALSVSMNNPTPVSSFQCDIHLPEGVHPVTDEDGYIELALSADRKAKAHVIDGAVQRSGAVRVIAYSSNNSLFKLNEGVLFTMALETAAAEPGIYEVTIDSIVGVNQNSKPLYLAPVTGSITMRPRMILGDANNDEVVNMTDVTFTVSHILGNTPEGFLFEAADVNLDKVINVADVNGVVDKMLAASTPASAPKRAAGMAVAPAQAENGSLYLQSFFLQPGEEAQMPVRLQAPRRYCAFQTDMYLPEGVEVVMVDEDGEVSADVWLNDKRATPSHTIVTRAQADGALRVAAYSGRNASFKDTGDEILFYVRVRASASFNAVPQPVWFRNTLFNSYVNNTPGEYYFVDHGPLMNVDGVLGNADVEVAAEAVYYNLQGLRVAEPQPGRMYIRVSGGRAQKIVY